MLKQIMYKTIIECVVLFINLKRIVHFEACLWKHLLCIENVLLTQVESRVVKQSRDTEGIDESVVVG